VPGHGAEIRVLDTDSGGTADSNSATFTIPAGLSDYDYSETQVTINTWNYPDDHYYADVVIPTGRVVLSAGGYPAEMYYTGGSPDGWYNETNWPTDTIVFGSSNNRYPVVSRPHPSDSTKWRVIIYPSPSGRKVKMNIFLITAVNLYVSIQGTPLKQ
jgi:hypothetical protein